MDLLAMTAEQLEELLGKVTQGEWVAERDGREGVIEKYGIYSDDMPVVSHFTAIESEPDAMLIAIAPSLARRVIAAEKLAEAVEYDLSCWPETMASILRDALTAYREASK